MDLKLLLVLLVSIIHIDACKYSCYECSTLDTSQCSAPTAEDSAIITSKKCDHCGVVTSYDSGSKIELRRECFNNADEDPGLSYSDCPQYDFESGSYIIVCTCAGKLCNGASLPTIGVALMWTILGSVIAFNF